STMAMTSISVQPTSSMKFSPYRPQGPSAVRDRSLDLVCLVIDRLRRIGRLVIRHALLEALDALGDIAHQFRNLAAAKQQQHHHQNDQPMPDAERTHFATPFRRVISI